MSGRTYNAVSSYRYGFNGKENDNEVKGEGNSLDFGARIYDSRVGRFLSTDPLEAKYPFLSPYCFVGDNPIVNVDPDGEKIVIYLNKEKTGTPVVINKISDIDLKLKNSKNAYLKAMHATLNYLKNEKVLQQAIKSPTAVNVYESPKAREVAGQYLNPEMTKSKTHEIVFNPTIGNATVTDEELEKDSYADMKQGPIQSPALGFLHELDHFLGWIKDDGKTSKKMSEPLPGSPLDNEEEARVILGTESEAAIRLNEPTRTNHGGVPVKVKGPTSTQKVADVAPSILIRQNMEKVKEQDKEKSN